jgi:type I restriction enzyme, S subunit
MPGWSRARVKGLATEIRETVDPRTVNTDEVFHYSIPSLDVHGDGAVEPVDDIGSNKLLLRGGEVLISKLNPRISRVLTASSHVVPTLASTEFIALVPGPELDSRFLCYWLQGEQTRQFLDGATMSVTKSQQRVRPDVLTGCWVDLPSVHTQCAIADYLDRETARIDALIAARRRMVDLLEERWRCAAGRLLTGADSQSQRWSLGPYWLDAVPRTWRPRKIAWCKATGSGTTPESSRWSYYADEGGVPWVTTTELRETDILTTLRTVTDEAILDYSALKIFPPGTVLMAMYGATVGRLGTLKTHATVNQACCAIWGDGDLDQDFMYWWLLAFRSHIVDMAYGSGQPNISQEMVRSLRIPAPQLNEQRNLAASVQTSRLVVERASRLLASQIELLEERRQALITAAVTGQIEISEAA